MSMNDNLRLRAMLTPHGGVTVAFDHGLSDITAAGVALVGALDATIMDGELHGRPELLAVQGPGHDGKGHPRSRRRSRLTTDPGAAHRHRACGGARTVMLPT